MHLSFSEHNYQANITDASDDLIIAALLHDIGQIVPLDTLKEEKMNLGGNEGNVGRIGHESIGAGYLRSLGFGDDVCCLVGSHVAAKRYGTIKREVH